MVRLVGGARAVGFGLFGSVLALLALELAALAAVQGGGRGQGARCWALALSQGGRTPSLSLSPGGGEMGMGSVSPGGGEMGIFCVVGGGMGMWSVFGSGRVIGGRFGVCTCGWQFFGGGETPSLCLSPAGGEIGRLGYAGEVFELLDVLADVVEGFAVFLGCFGPGVVVVVMMAVSRGGNAPGGAVFFGHLRAGEHHEEGRRAVGLSGVLEEYEVDLLGVFEDGQLEAIVEAEGVLGLPFSDSADGDAGSARGASEGPGLGVESEVDGLSFPRLALLGCEVVEAEAEILFELGGLLGG